MPILPREACGRRRAVHALALLLFLLFVPCTAHADHDYGIYLKARTFTPAAGVEPALSAYVGSVPNPRIHCIVQFDHIPHGYEVLAFENAGGVLGEYLPNFSYFASIPNTTPDLSTIAALPFVRAMVFIATNDKIEPLLLSSGVPAHADNGDGTANFRVVMHPDVSPTDAATLLLSHGTILTGPDDWFTYAVRISDTGYSALAAEDEVQWVEPVAAPEEGMNDGALSNSDTTRLERAGYDLEGSGIRLGIMDTGWADKGQDDFIPDAKGSDTGFSRVKFQEAGGSNSDHATHVAGTMAGDGGLSQGKGGTKRQWRGVLRQADIYSYRYNSNDDEEPQEQKDAILANQLDLFNNSWGSSWTNCLGCYDTRASEFDDVVRSAGSPLIFAAGNRGSFGSICTDNTRDRFYDSLSPPGGTAKNTIVVGAVYSDDPTVTIFSSWGPTDDGRIKPDLVAPGDQKTTKNNGNWSWNLASGGDFATVSTKPSDTYTGFCGTSMAAPVVSGIAGAVIEAWRKAHFPGIDPRPSTVRAILAQTTLPTDGDAFVTAPDYRRGYGRACGSCAADVARQRALFGQAALQLKASFRLDFNTVAFKAPQLATVDPNTPVRITLAWDDPKAAVNAARTLVNDLDLKVVAPDGTVYWPASLDRLNPANPATTAGPNRTDNLEQVNIPLSTVIAKQGLWTVSVLEHMLVSPQRFALIYPTFPAGGQPKPAGPRLRWRGLSGGPDRTGSSISPVPATNHVLWSTATGGAVNSSPAVDGDLLFVGSDDGKVYALNVADGSVAWSQSVGSPAVSSPATDGERVYIGGGDGKMYAFDRDTGAPVWTYDPPGAVDPAVDSSPVVSDSVVYVGMGSSLVALLANPGTPTPTDLWSATLGGAVHGSPAVAGGMVFVGADDGKLYARNASSGAPVWDVPIGGLIRGAPALFDGIVYAASTSGSLVGIGITGGSLVWGPVTIGGGVGGGGGVVLDPLAVFGASDGTLYARDALTGAPAWSHAAGGAITTSPVATEGAVIFGASNNIVRAVSATTGTTLWTVTTGGAVDSSPALDEGVVYVGSGDGKVYAIADDTDGDGVPDERDVCVSVMDASQTDTDGDGEGDACDLDDDNDNVTDTFEGTLGTNPLVADTDTDGLEDGEEVAWDGDGATYTPGSDTNPLNIDTDGDSYSDGIEAAAGSDPLDAQSQPVLVPALGSRTSGLVIAALVFMAFLVFRPRAAPGP